ncbi:recombinase family protein, partial [Mesorhizobium sp. M0510]|uniref:recombinase family protein n=1 Tax=Mesorhizobium sp. M0510 TaxID=2956954 RepID=UPI003336CB2E
GALSRPASPRNRVRYPIGISVRFRFGITVRFHWNTHNGRDWHTLIEFCGLVGTLIIDENGIYEPRHPNDRLLLGMKGTMSELELSILRARSLEALKNKARRGELFLAVAVGYVKAGNDRIEMDPDLRVREAITLVFTRFAALQSIRQVHLSLRHEGIILPAVNYTRAAGRTIVWKLPVYNTVHHILTNPIYAGAYAFGRTGSRITIESGRKRIVRGLRKEQSTGRSCSSTITRVT